MKSENANPMRWHWMSFCDERKPEGQRFLGVCLVRASSAVEAIYCAHLLQINPGGCVADWEMPADYNPPMEFRNRLLNKADIIKLQGSAQSVGETGTVS